MSTQPPLQVVVPDGQGLTQTPEEHSLPVGHGVPHLLQLNGSVLRLTQPPLQLVVGGGQLPTHLLLAHTSPAPQTCPHVPQFLGSCVRLTHLPEHVVCPLMQPVGTHLPWLRLVCGGHPHRGLACFLCLCFGWMQISPLGQHFLPHLT